MINYCNSERVGNCQNRLVLGSFLSSCRLVAMLFTIGHGSQMYPRCYWGQLCGIFLESEANMILILHEIAKIIHAYSFDCSWKVVFTHLVDHMPLVWHVSYSCDELIGYLDSPLICSLHKILLSSQVKLGNWFGKEVSFFFFLSSGQIMHDAQNLNGFNLALRDEDDVGNMLFGYVCEIVAQNIVFSEQHMISWNIISIHVIIQSEFFARMPESIPHSISRRRMSDFILVDEKCPLLQWFT